MFQIPAKLFAAIVLISSPAIAADGSTLAESPLQKWSEDRTTVFDASEIDLNDFRWLARPVVVFADTEADPAFKQQLDLLQARVEELTLRDVILITDTSPEEPSNLRAKLRPRGFMLTLIGKDGGVKLRKPFPWDVRELSRAIDKMPMRQQEIRDNLRNGG